MEGGSQCDVGASARDTTTTWPPRARHILCHDIRQQVERRRRSNQSSRDARTHTTHRPSVPHPAPRPASPSPWTQAVHLAQMSCRSKSARACAAARACTATPMLYMHVRGTGRADAEHEVGLDVQNSCKQQNAVQSVSSSEQVSSQWQHRSSIDVQRQHFAPCLTL